MNTSRTRIGHPYHWPAVTLLLLVAASMAAATPWFTQDPRTLPAGRWRAEEHVLSTDLSHALVDGERVALPGGLSEATALTLHTRLRYGVRDDLTVFIDTPYVFKRTHDATGVVRDHNGWGDVMLLAKYKYAEDKAAGKRRAVATFYKTHTGAYEGLPGLLATGSGQDNLGLLHLWEWRGHQSTWYANTGYVWTGRRDDTGRNPGDLWLFNLAAEHRLRQSSWNFVWELNGQYEGRAATKGVTAANSGATVLSLAPGFQHVSTRPGGKSVTWEAGVQFPVMARGNLAAIPSYTVYLGGYTVF